MAGRHRKCLKCSGGKFVIRRQFIVYKRGEGKTWFSLNLFNTKMALVLVLVNKAIRESLWAADRSIVECLGPGSVPSGSSSIEATLKSSRFTIPFEDFALFHPLSVWSIRLYPYPLAVPIYLRFTHPILQPLFYPGITPLALWLAYQNRPAFPCGLKAINANWRQGPSLSSSQQVSLFTWRGGSVGVCGPNEPATAPVLPPMDRYTLPRYHWENV